MKKTLVYLLAMLLLSACATGPTPEGERDGPPANPPDLSRIENPEPRWEPRSRLGNPVSYEVFGRTYTPMRKVGRYSERGIASWYGKKFHGRLTSSGEPYDMYQLTAAHRELPIPVYVRVTNRNNGRQVIVRVNDRGPFAHDRIIDLSYAAAAKLDMLEAGTAPVEIEVLTPDPPSYSPEEVQRQEELQAVPAVKWTSGHVFVQVGAFSQRQNADALITRLRALNLNAPVEIHSSKQESSGLYRVRLGPLLGVEQASRVYARLAEHGMKNSRLVIQD